MTSERLSAALAGRYRIERELGAGGMATVYLAHDVRHDRRGAIKLLKPELAAVLGAGRFVVEIKTTASLQATIVAASLAGGPALSVASRRIVSSGIATDVNGTNSNWDVFPDGKLLVIDQGGGASGRRVALIQNWPALARSLEAKQ